MKKYTIGILTWNSKKLIAPLLESIEQHGSEYAGEVVVVDNGSADGTIELIEKDHPAVTLVKNDVNRGVAPARNQIFRRSESEYVIILDVDTLVLPGAVDTLIRVMDRRPDAGIGGPKLLYRDHSLQLSCRPFPTIMNIALEGTFLRKYFAGSRFVRDYTMEDWDHESLREVDWMYGACLIIRKSMLDHIGLFDEGYFYLYEDVDLCLRARQNGYQVLYIPEARVVHFLERERRPIFSKTLIVHLRSISRYMKKYYFGSGSVSNI